MRSVSQWTTEGTAVAVPARSISPEFTVPARRLGSNRAREAAWAYLFLAPFFLGLLFFILGPVLAALAISFTSWDLLSAPRWIGLANYREMMGDRLFQIALKNTVYFTVVSVPVTLLLALGLASLMNRKLRGISVLRAVYFFPVTASIVAVSLLWAWMYTPDFGIINYLLSLLGLPKVKWLVDPTMAMPSVIIMSVWRGLGFNIVIFLAGLQSIPRDLYEAAELDGAQRMEPVPRHHGSPAHTDDFLRNDHGIDRELSGLRANLYHDPGWTRQCDADARLPNLPQWIHLPPHGLCLGVVVCALRHSVRHHDRPGQIADEVGPLCVIHHRAPQAWSGVVARSTALRMPS